MCGGLIFQRDDLLFVLLWKRSDPTFVHVFNMHKDSVNSITASTTDVPIRKQSLCRTVLGVNTSYRFEILHFLSCFTDIFSFMSMGFVRHYILLILTIRCCSPRCFQYHDLLASQDPLLHSGSRLHLNFLHYFCCLLPKYLQRLLPVVVEISL